MYQAAQSTLKLRLSLVDSKKRSSLGMDQVLILMIAVFVLIDYGM
ncbi:hypothetical protein KP509_32G062700 [Ceratopteris richardii]|uniref:Uncharacterized protein n=1 Tax=Ceratopteris richardii TaxID=49495 RepID=A0A8T2QVV6_CERRI|nr:hypothetical protein KP509_32G062700 [Ceratopteris richardii]